MPQLSGNCSGQVCNKWQQLAIQPAGGVAHGYRSWARQSPYSRHTVTPMWDVLTSIPSTSSASASPVVTLAIAFVLVYGNDILKRHFQKGDVGAEARQTACAAFRCGALR